MPRGKATAFAADMQRIYACKLALFLNAVLMVLIVAAVSRLTFDSGNISAETLALTAKQFLKRASARELHSQSSKLPASRSAAKTARGDILRKSEARLANMWPLDGSIVRVVFAAISFLRPKPPLAELFRVSFFRPFVI
jgi:hypothetical protein